MDDIAIYYDEYGSFNEEYYLRQHSIGWPDLCEHYQNAMILIQNNDLECLDHFLTENPKKGNIYQYNTCGESLILSIIRMKLKPLKAIIFLKMLQKHQVDFTEKINFDTPLSLAAILGQLEVFKFLVDIIKPTQDIINHCLVEVCRKNEENNFSTFVYLIENCSADINAPSRFYGPPLVETIKSSNIKKFNYIISKNPDIQHKKFRNNNTEWKVALNFAFELLPHSQIIKYSWRERKNARIISIKLIEIIKYKITEVGKSNNYLPSEELINMFIGNYREGVGDGSRTELFELIKREAFNPALKILTEYFKSQKKILYAFLNSPCHMPVKDCQNLIAEYLFDKIPKI